MKVIQSPSRIYAEATGLRSVSYQTAAGYATYVWAILNLMFASSYKNLKHFSAQMIFELLEGRDSPDNNKLILTAGFPIQQCIPLTIEGVMQNIFPNYEIYSTVDPMKWVTNPYELLNQHPNWLRKTCADILTDLRTAPQTLVVPRKTVLYGGSIENDVSKNPRLPSQIQNDIMNGVLSYIIFVDEDTHEEFIPDIIFDQTWNRMIRCKYMPISDATDSTRNMINAKPSNPPTSRFYTWKIVEVDTIKNIINDPENRIINANDPVMPVLYLMMRYAPIYMMYPNASIQLRKTSDGSGYMPIFHCINRPKQVLETCAMEYRVFTPPTN